MESQYCSTSFGQCRCCLGRGSHMDVMKEYYISGTREVYLDIFMDCFNLFLCTNTNITTLICHSCVKSLRDANHFKTMVVNAEQQLLKTVRRDDNQTLFVNVPVTTRVDETDLDIKLEVETDVKRELTDSEFETEEHDVEESIIHEHNRLKKIGVNDEHNKIELKNVKERSNQDRNIHEHDNKESSSKKRNNRNSKLSNKRRNSERCSKKRNSKERSNIESNSKILSSKESDSKKLSTKNRSSEKRSSIEHSDKKRNITESSNKARKSKDRKCKNKNFGKNDNDIEDHNDEIDKTYDDDTDSDCLPVGDSFAMALPSKVIGDPEKVKHQNLVDGEADLIARYNPGELKPLPNRDSLYKTCANYVLYLDELKETFVTAKDVEKLLEKPFKKLPLDKKVFVTEKLANVVNVTTLLECSNLTAFKTRMKYGFPCFYCRTIFDNLTILREHQQKDHKDFDIRKFVAKYTADCLIVYVDVKDLKCKLCDEEIPNLQDLKDHLTKKHEKKMYLDYPDRIIPFKFTKNSYECQNCGFGFETFGAIERHMNVHYRNFVCEECGAGFVTKHRLKVHTYTLHTGRSYPCESCKKVFTSHQKHKIHVASLHKNVKGYKCAKCDQRFIDYFTRHKHMVECHDAAPIQYQCNVCFKQFKRKYALSCHTKRTHLAQRDFECKLCDYKGFDNHELKAHMTKHGGEKKFECNVCQKAFARKKNLKEHLKTHNTNRYDKRYSCEFCGRKFQQNSSLKTHMKSHNFI